MPRWWGAVLVGATMVAGCPAEPEPGQTTLGTSGPGGDDGTSDTDGAGATSTDGDAGATAADETGTTGEETDCSCAPGTDVIHVLSDDGELWAYDPPANAFASIGTIQCGGFAPFSMAVDRTGQAWVLLLDNVPHATVAKGVFKVSIADATGCETVVYEEGLFGAFGMSFVTNGPPDNCEKLYAHSYSGSGPFTEAPDAGLLGVLDEDDAVLQSVGPIDYDGGELAGTGDGRLFTFAGVDPVKLVELDKDTAEEIQVLPLPGVAKTSASAVAFYGGDFYLFFESGNPECMPCLQRSCTEELDACAAEPGCAEVQACLLAGGGEGPGCEGDLPGAAAPLRDCMWSACTDSCDRDGVVSQVVHVDWDDSDGGGQAVTVVEPFAPVRIVGAGSSTCVPVFVP